MRWRAVFYFAFFPTLFMVFMQGSVFYTESRLGPMYWHWKLLEPFLFCAPICLIIAATGYGVAIRCLGRSIGSALGVGCIVGVCWAIVVMVVGNTIAQMNGAAPLTLDRLVTQALVLPAILVPVAVLLCLFTRWRGKRLGFLTSKHQPA